MRWPPWSSDSPSSSDDEPTSKPKDPISWTTTLNATDWSHYTDPRTIIPTVLLTGTTFFFYRFYRSYLRRIPQAASISPGFWRKRSLFGTVTSVGDGDNFRLFHTPGGRLAGWGWLPGRKKVPGRREELKDRTVCARWHTMSFPHGPPMWSSSVWLTGMYLVSRSTSASPASTPRKWLTSAGQNKHTLATRWSGSRTISCTGEYGPMSIDATSTIGPLRPYMCGGGY